MLPKLPLTFCALLPVAAFAAQSPAAFIGAPTLADDALGQLRGGVLLPNGLDVALGFDIQTLVDGRLALHTVLSTEPPASNRLRVLVGDRPDPMVTGPAVLKPQEAAPELLFDRRGAGPTLTVAPSAAGSAATPTVNVFVAPREIWPAYPGETEIAPTPGGPPVPTALGAVSVTAQPDGQIVTLSSDSLVIRHLVGQATGVIVANSASDRRIDTVSTIDVDLKGAWVPVANGLFGVNAVAADAISRR